MIVNTVKPTVSIIIATYNRAHFIVETLKSVQQQTFKDWECLIIDDGGSDNTQKVISPMLNLDNRFRYFLRTKKYKKGLPGSRNYGLDLAKGDYIVFFDDDDITHPLNLELCAKELVNQDISFCRYEREVFRDNFHYNFDFSKTYDSFKINTSCLEGMIKNELPFNSCAVIWKRECFDRNRFIEHLMYAEEWELYSRILLDGYSGISISKTLFFGRKHAKSNTGEYYRNDPIRRASKKNAILLIVQNLKEKQLLTPSLIHYFAQLSLDFKEEQLFKKILFIIELSRLENIKWKLFYFSLPLRLFLFGHWKKIKNI